MPRDDLSIDFVKRMPQGGEALDPALILDDFINRVANLPEEIRFLQDEIAEKDRQYNECIRIIEERDGRIQKFIKANSSHDNNPREEGYRKTIVENFKKAEVLADEKIALTQKMQAIIDRHTRQLDMQIKQLYDRAEPGFTDPDELPSLLRPTAANKATAASMRASMAASASASNPSAAVGNMIKEATKAAASASGGGGGMGNTVIAAGGGRGSGSAQARHTAQQGHSSSAPASPAASMILGRQARESSAGPGVAPGKRGPRTNSSLANAPPASSGLARHASLGPGTPKAHAGAGGNVPRAGSAGPRAIAKGAGAGSGRKGSTPAASSGGSVGATGLEKTGPGRKKGNAGTNTPTTKTGLSRVKRPAKASAASSTADESELSDASSTDDDSDASSSHATPTRGSSQGGAGSGSGSNSANGGGSHGGGNGAGNKDGSASQPLVKRERDSGNGISSSIGSASNGNGSSGPNGLHGPRGGVTKHRAGDKPGRANKGGAPSSDDRMDVDDEEAGDDNKYCLCQNVSFGDMVACDNEDCPFEWFHWSCVGLKSEPNGTWYCPVCTEKKGKQAGGGGSGGGSGSGGTSGANKDGTRNGDGGAGGNTSSGNGSAASAGGAASAGDGGTSAATKKGK